MYLNHISINVRSLEESLQFYQDIFGMQISADLRPLGKNIVFISDIPKNFQIELLEEADDFFAGNGISIAWKCEDLDMEYDRMKELRLRTSDIISPMEDVRFFYVEDPNGLLIQIV